MADFPLDFTFSPVRVLRLIRNRIVFQWRSALLFTVVLTGVFIAFEALFGHNTTSTNLTLLWNSISGTAVLLVAAGSFSDIHRSARAQWWFLLPASVLEKFTAALAVILGLTFIGLPLWGVVSDALARTLGYLLGSRGMESYQLFDRLNWDFIRGTLMAFPMFLLGSTVFKKHPFFKTILAAVLFVGLALGFLVGLGWLFLGSTNVQVSTDTVTWGTYTLITDRAKPLGWVAVWLFGVGYPVLFLTASFLKLGEKEVQGGIS